MYCFVILNLELIPPHSLEFVHHPHDYLAASVGRPTGGVFPDASDPHVQPPGVGGCGHSLE